MKCLRWAGAIFICGTVGLGAWPLAAPAQEQEEQISLGEIARRARGQKKQARKPTHPPADDNLPKTSGAGPNDLAAGTAATQQAAEEEISLGEIARRFREQKKQARNAARRGADNDLRATSGAGPKGSRSAGPAQANEQLSVGGDARRLGEREERAPESGRAQGDQNAPAASEAATTDSVAGATSPSLESSAQEQILQSGRTSILQENFVEAIRVLEDGQKHFPRDLEITLELGRAYLYDGKDERAIGQFREVLLENPSNRLAKLQLARALSYQNNYEASDVLYRELLLSNPDDEGASLGLIRNLVEQKRLAEARQELEISLTHHPGSQQLQEYKQVLEGEQEGDETAGNKKVNRVQTSETYITDSAGNRAWRSSQLAGFQFGSRMKVNLQAEEQLLQKNQGARVEKAGILRVTEQLRLRLTPFLFLSGSGGTVRFADRRTRGLFQGDLELHPAGRLWISGGFSRVPIYPTVQATRFNLLAQGWHARVDWDPGLWRINAGLSSLTYSDGNHDHRENLEVLRWRGSRRLAFAIGYRVDLLNFRRTLNHGYFDPSRYQSHLGIGGANFALGKRFRAEYLVRFGGQSISPGPFRLAWELSLRNRLTLWENWELGADYLYLQLAQSTGALNGQATVLWIAYRY